MSLAFILKRFLPNKHKLSVLTKTHGKIYLTTEPMNKSLSLWPGMLISFDTKEERKNIHLATNIEILLTPDSKFDLNWIHHILELSYYFIPMHNPCNEVFRFIYNCFRFTKLEIMLKKHAHIIRKISLLKFFELAGFYPKENLSVYLRMYDKLANAFVDIDNKQNVNSLQTSLEQISEQQVKELDFWIFSCIHHHPCSKLFKTCLKL